MRRLRARPPSVRLSAIGRRAPKPRVRNRSAGTPRAMSASRTAAARASLKPRLNLPRPTGSVWPSMRMTPGQLRTSLASRSRSAPLRVPIAALPLPNSICSPASASASERSQSCAALSAGAMEPLAAGAGAAKRPTTVAAQLTRPIQLGQVTARASATARPPAPAAGSSPESVTVWPEAERLTQLKPAAASRLRVSRATLPSIQARASSRGRPPRGPAVLAAARLLATIAAGVPVQARTIADNTPAATREAEDLGPANASETISVTLWLQAPGSEAAAEQLVRELYDQCSPRFHRWLSEPEANALLAPSAAQADRVQKYLTEHGLRVVAG